MLEIVAVSFLVTGSKFAEEGKWEADESFMLLCLLVIPLGPFVVGEILVLWVESHTRKEERVNTVTLLRCRTRQEQEKEFQWESKKDI